MAAIKRLLVWLFYRALSIEVDGVRYVADWSAIEAIATTATAAIALLAIWYSIRSLGRQLRHQADSEAKKLEEQLLLRVMDLAQVPYDASLEFVRDIVLWRAANGPAANPQFLAEAGGKLLDSHRRLSTATASALAVLRRSRPRRFRRGTQDEALVQYDDLIQRVLAANARILEYASGDARTFEILQFEEQVGRNAFDIANLLRRVTAELLARMYSDAPEWSRLQFQQLGQNEAGRVGFDFADNPALGRNG